MKELKETQITDQNTKNSFDYTTYARNMRLALSHPDVVTRIGDINHQYFLHKKDAYWGPNEDQALKKGLDEFGEDNWFEIKEKYKLLKKFFDIELELRTTI